MMAVNLRGTWLASRAVVPHMRKRGYGKIINISSETALKGSASASTTSPRRRACWASRARSAREVGNGRHLRQLHRAGSTLSEENPDEGIVRMRSAAAGSARSASAEAGGPRRGDRLLRLLRERLHHRADARRRRRRLHALVGLRADLLHHRAPPVGIFAPDHFGELGRAGDFPALRPARRTPRSDRGLETALPTSEFSRDTMPAAGRAGPDDAHPCSRVETRAARFG